MAVHMGLNSGRGGVGSTRLEGALDSRWTFTASGPVTNLAARLADAAAPGTILVGPETSKRIGTEFTLEQNDVGELKNLAERIERYRLGAEKARHGSHAMAPSLGQHRASLAFLKFAEVRV